MLKSTRKSPAVASLSKSGIGMPSFFIRLQWPGLQDRDASLGHSTACWKLFHVSRKTDGKRRLLLRHQCGEQAASARALHICVSLNFLSVRSSSTTWLKHQANDRCVLLSTCTTSALKVGLSVQRCQNVLDNLWYVALQRPSVQGFLRTKDTADFHL